jgi:hypothetical protein
LTNSTERKSPFYYLVDKAIVFCNAFSILVVFGSVSTASFFSYYWEVGHDLFFYWLLGSSVWLIYTIDHLFDAFRLGNHASSLRHQLHYKFRYLLLVIVFFVLGFNITEAWLLWQFFVYIPFGTLLFALFCLYLVLVMWFHKNGKPVYLKEVWVAIFATMGMAFSPVFGESIQLDAGNLLILLNFTLLNFANLLTFSRFDLRNDRTDNMLSLAAYLGFAKTSRWIFNLLALVFFITVVWLFAEDWHHKIKGALAFILMINILALINFRYYVFRQNARYRFWGDLIYLIPGLVVYMRI